jgi:hypothetical protein
MRKATILFILLTFLAVSGAFAAYYEAPFEKIFEAPGNSKDQIFDGSKVWIAEKFRSAKAVLEYENKEAGTIIGNGMIPYPCSGWKCMGASGWKVMFTMRVDIKDQRFRLTFSNFRVLGSVPGPNGEPIGTESSYNNVMNVLIAYGDEMLSSFARDKKKDDW